MQNSTISALRTVQLEDIPLEYRDIAEALGLESFLNLSRLCGGDCVYLPKISSLQREGRDREIRARFNGGNYRELAAQFRLSERYVRKIIHHQRPADRRCS